MKTWTLKRKLIGFACMALAATLTLAFGSFYLTRMFQAAFADYSLGMHAVQQSMLADMAHDAIRADVYAALNAARTNDAGGVAEASKELDEHIASMKNALASNDRATLPPEAKEALATVTADLTPYHQSASQIVASASSDVAAAESKLPEFLKRYSALEGSLAASGEALEKIASEGMAASEKTVGSGNLALGIIALCAVLMQLLICYLLGRSILKQVGGEPAYAAAVAKRIARAICQRPWTSKQTTRTACSPRSRRCSSS